MATTADQLMAPALVPTNGTNGNQSTVLSVATTMQSNTSASPSTNSNLKSNSGPNNEEETAVVQHQVDNNKSTSPKPNAMNSLKLIKMGSVSTKDKRVYKIVLTGGKLQNIYVNLSKLFFCISLFTM